jgi:small Trp-rich protein
VFLSRRSKKLLRYSGFNGFCRAAVDASPKSDLHLKQGIAMYLVVLGAILLLLKTFDVSFVDKLPWWGALLPLGLAMIWWAWADASGWTKRREMDKMELRKKERRLQSMEALGTAPKKRK